MNLFKKNDRKTSSQTSTSKNNPKQGNPMNASTEIKPIDPVTPIDPVKPVVNPSKPQENDVKQNKGAMVVSREHTLEGNKQ